MPDESPSDPQFWEALYARGADRWELTRPAPPLARWFDATPPPSDTRALVVGCGRGHEARMLAAHGADVVAVDFAPGPIADARRLAVAAGVTLGAAGGAERSGRLGPSGAAGGAERSGKIDFRQRDLFRLLDDPERYELIVEHCCFCAIDRARREEYVEVMARLLVESGELVGLFWSCGRAGGPPFTVDAAELERLFAPRFALQHLSVPADSVEARQGQELLAVFRRR